MTKDSTRDPRSPDFIDPEIMDRFDFDQQHIRVKVLGFTVQIFAGKNRLSETEHHEAAVIRIHHPKSDEYDVRPLELTINDMMDDFAMLNGMMDEEDYNARIDHIHSKIHEIMTTPWAKQLRNDAKIKELLDKDKEKE